MNGLMIVGITNGCGDDGWIFSLGRGYGFDVWVWDLEMAKNGGISTGWNCLG